MKIFAKMQDYLNPDHAALSWDQAIKELMEGKVAFSSISKPDGSKGGFYGMRDPYISEPEPAPQLCSRSRFCGRLLEGGWAHLWVASYAALTWLVSIPYDP